ncbi:MAG: hypothetical protein IKC11_03955 [Clostridia bacterium]|nr:hypothetical protein [Clostridia bacterium]
MEKQKKILLISLSIVATLSLLTIVLFATKVFGLIAFLCSFCPLVILLGVVIFLYVKLLKKMKKKKAEPVKVETSGDPLIDIYEALGIPLQYNKDGSIKDIYEVLGIEPIYDEEGNRVLTIYELLGIMPKFDKNGKEIPQVLVIKNRVKRFAKVDITTRVMTRKLSEAEKEERFIKETLKQKIDEAEKNGDIEKASAIKKVLKSKAKSKAKSKPKSKPSSKKPSGGGADKPKYSIGKSKGALKADKLDKFPTMYKGNLINELFSFAAATSGKKPNKSEKPQETKPPEPPKPPVQPQKPPVQPTVNKPSAVNIFASTQPGASNDAGVRITASTNEREL